MLKKCENCENNSETTLNYLGNTYHLCNKCYNKIKFK